MYVEEDSSEDESEANVNLTKAIPWTKVVTSGKADKKIAAKN